MLPFFQQNYEAGGRQATLIRREWIDAIAKKWARGIYCVQCGKLLPAHAEVEVYFLRKDAEWEVFGELLQIAEPMHRGPDLQILLSRGKNTEREAIVASFRLWQEFKVHCVVTVSQEAAPAI